MYNPDLNFTVTYKNKDYVFNNKCCPYIFGLGIENDMFDLYGEDDLLRYVSLVYRCYAKDSNPITIEEYANFIAENLKKCRYMGAYNVIDLYYDKKEIL